MSYQYKICEKKDEAYGYSFSLDENLVFNYNTDDLFSIVEDNKISIICYGYCFDVREPELLTRDTLKSLYRDINDIEKEIQYLNGQYILIVQKNEDIYLYSDGSALVPVYILKNDNIITNIISNSNEAYYRLNPNFKFNLKTFMIQRLQCQNNYENLNDENLVSYLMSLISNQYEYFIDKKIDIRFQADNYHKALFAILSPILANKNMIVEENSTTINDYFSELFANEFRMNIIRDLEVTEKNKESDNNRFIARNNLSNFKALYIKKNKQLKNQKMLTLYNDKNDLELYNYEMNLMEINNKSNLELSDKYLIYEPLNVREILNVFIELQNRTKFKIHQEVINKFRPSLYYFNFTKGKTLREINQELTEEITDIKNNGISTENQKFLLDVKRSNFRTSQNLDGKIKNNELITFPSNQKIKKGNEYIIDFINHTEGLVYIEGFYKNEKNANRIIVTVNGEIFNIFDFYKGRYFYHNGKTRVTVKYMNDYNNLSWQKAGTLLIKQA
ncbi:hypothetical protein [Salinicoccus halodurans]|uniref:Uncharacterized protein n=1 Tax=Salinicoccus halodurans TaxID=407035 RepID=A0A0F7HIS3_9STAP|nr:hypothetical protein [Salinicoccus halodurans]AKG73421.1 hypothetical protein AAT16_03815 [Salinicoccus halodurans]SFK80938.1 hypothetical protein SAMN05216235_1757 [Salinicoccus halodurans]